LMLRAMTEVLGNLGRPFDAQLGRAGSRHASELREVRNTWAHNGTFTDEDAYRAVDTAQRLLALMGAPEADELAYLRRELQAAMAAPFAAPAGATPTDETLEDDMQAVGAPPSSSVTADQPAPVQRPVRGPADGGEDSSPVLEPEFTVVPEPPRGARTDASLAKIDVSAVPVVSYAMAHNSLPVVSQVVIRMDGPSVDGAQLTIGLETADGPLGEPKEFFVDLVEGEDTTVPQVDLLLDPQSMSRVEAGLWTLSRTRLWQRLGRMTGTTRLRQPSCLRGLRRRGRRRDENACREA
jgi:hypothetical protein